jgi:isoleucyl-tRNA synthetase
LKRIADSYRRIRNTARFMLANLTGFDPSADRVAFEKMLPLDRWIVDQAAALQREIEEAYESYEFHRIYQRVHNFCVVDMGSFYLDIIKDRQYTMQADSLGRRSAQTALYHMLEAFTRWIAPVLSFTAEEIWQHLPGEREESVLLSTWYDGFPREQEKAFGSDYWQRLIEIREVVAKEIERQRGEDKIGGSLEAEVDLYAPAALGEQLERVGDELRFLLITSTARVHPLEQRPDGAVSAALEDGTEFALTVRASEHAKCVRCWHRREDVGAHAGYAELCGRCVENVAGSGEVRRYG